MIFLCLAPQYQQSPWTTSKIQVEYSIARLTSYEKQSTGLKQKHLQSTVRALNLGEKIFLSFFLRKGTSKTFHDGKMPRGGVLRISSDEDDRMGRKIKTQKYPLGFKQNPKKSLDQNFTPKYPMPNFRAIKIYSWDYKPRICWKLLPRIFRLF